MSDHPKISIISTVYNTGPYLRPAVESILAQTFTDFELLLVDDGSHDGSAEVCDALAAQDTRIRVFHQANGGPAHARNTGLDNVRGDYIGIVDSDDLIEPTMFETLYNAVQAPGVRLAACAADCIDADGSKIEGRMVTIRQTGVRCPAHTCGGALVPGSLAGRPEMPSGRLYCLGCRMSVAASPQVCMSANTAAFHERSAARSTP